ncbi:hypothetical protein WG922_05685 [Ramlibacter sp. AN1015]|uniref:hypothetical protein n=1 Tax=Ramlibacter sp. AN1015 TaxID=3133428 RepID=UPI0030BBC1D7
MHPSNRLSSRPGTPPSSSAPSPHASAVAADPKAQAIDDAKTAPRSRASLQQLRIDTALYTYGRYRCGATPRADLLLTQQMRDATLPALERTLQPDLRPALRDRKAESVRPPRISSLPGSFAATVATSFASFASFASFKAGANKSCAELFGLPDAAFTAAFRRHIAQRVGPPGAVDEKRFARGVALLAELATQTCPPTLGADEFRERIHATAGLVMRWLGGPRLTASRLDQILGVICERAAPELTPALVKALSQSAQLEAGAPNRWFCERFLSLPAWTHEPGWKAAALTLVLRSWLERSAMQDVRGACHMAPGNLIAEFAVCCAWWPAQPLASLAGAIGRAVLAEGGPRTMQLLEQLLHASNPQAWSIAVMRGLSAAADSDDAIDFLYQFLLRLNLPKGLQTRRPHLGIALASAVPRRGDVAGGEPTRGSRVLREWHGGAGDAVADTAVSYGREQLRWCLQLVVENGRDLARLVKDTGTLDWMAARGPAAHLRLQPEMAAPVASCLAAAHAARLAAGATLPDDLPQRLQQAGLPPRKLAETIADVALLCGHEVSGAWLASAHEALTADQPAAQALAALELLAAKLRAGLSPVIAAAMDRARSTEACLLLRPHIPTLQAQLQRLTASETLRSASQAWQKLLDDVIEASERIVVLHAPRDSRSSQAPARADAKTGPGHGEAKPAAGAQKRAAIVGARGRSLAELRPQISAHAAEMEAIRQAQAHARAWEVQPPACGPEGSKNGEASSEAPPHRSGAADGPLG